MPSIKPGVTMIIMHCMVPTDVFKHISDSGPTHQGDLKGLMDPELKRGLENEGIILTTWRELKKQRGQVK
jgi:chitin disaccharide deacetylase